SGTSFISASPLDHTVFSELTTEHAARAAYDQTPGKRKCAMVAVSPPLALKHKRRPIERRFPSFLFPHLNLRRSESSRRPQSASKHSLVESLHQFRRRFILHVPQACHHSRCSRVHESASQSHQPFAFHFLSQCCLTRAQNHHVSSELQIVNVMQSQEPILRPALLVHQREHHAGQFGVLAVDE